MVKKVVEENLNNAVKNIQPKKSGGGGGLVIAVIVLLLIVIVVAVLYFTGVFDKKPLEVQ